MPYMLSTETKMPLKYSIPLFFALVTAGLAGNYFKYPIFLNIDFLFGSIFAMLVLQFFGISRGLVAAAAISQRQKIIALTAYSLRGDQEKFLEDGFDGYLSKPLEVKELLREMKRVITSVCGKGDNNNGKK